MRRCSRIVLAAVVPGLLAGLPPAQSPDSTTAPRLRGPSLFANVGLHTSDGQLVGGGPRYTVQFGNREVCYTPSLGRAAPRTMPLTVRLHSVRRDRGQWLATQGKRSHEGHTVRYVHPGFEERYDLRREGLEQSFVFDRLPDGGGDLVVRLDVATELAAPAAGGATSEGLRFELPGVGAVTVGAVLGIDATGMLCGGSLRYEAGALELVLPSSFVDSAVLPLTLDPLVGTAVRANGAADDSRRPDIAYDATNDVYLVVWEHWVSAADRDIRGQRLDSGGRPVGNLRLIATGRQSDATPQVANVNGQNAFVVVWNELQTPTAMAKIRGRAVLAASGLLGTAIDLAASATENATQPDIGGEFRSDFNGAVLVWRQGNPGAIRYQQVQVQLSVISPRGTAGTLASNGVGAPAISKSGGDAGRYLVVWERTIPAGGGTTFKRVDCALLTRTAAVLDNLTTISDPNFDNEDPDVDGDGNNWVVAWERSEDPLGQSSRDDIVCRRVAYDLRGVFGDRAYLPGATEVVEGDRNVDEQDPAVGWTGGSVLIGFEEEIGGRHDARVESINPFTCSACETATFHLVSGSDDEQDVAIASRMSGGALGDQSSVLVACAVLDAVSGAGDVLARLFRADDGLVTSLGGGCGFPGGDVHAACARQGHGDFEFTLRGSDVNESVWMVLSFGRIELPCGSCRLVPDPFTGWVFARTTDTRGDASVTIPIPASSVLSGLVAWQQWLVMDGTSPACQTFQANLTSPLEVEIQ